MPKLHKIYTQLQQIDDVSVDRAMTAALPTADRLALRLIALLLLKRGHPDGLLGLVLHYHLLPPDIQHTVASHAGDLFSSLRKAAGMGHTHGPLNALQIVHRSLNAPLAYLAVDQLRHGSTEAQGSAGACLLHLARHAASDPRPGVLPQIEPANITYLQTALDNALGAFRQHEQRSVLVGSAWLAMRGGESLRQALADKDEPTTVAMANLLEEGEQPAVVRSLIVFVTVPTLREPALRGLRRAAARRDGLGPMLGHFHTLWLPGLDEALARLDTPTAFCLNDTQSRALPPHECRGLPAWLMALPLTRDDKIQQLVKLRHLPDPATRLMALRRLMRLAEQSHDDGVLDAIALFCEDADAQFAGIALRHLIRQEYAGLPRLLMRLLNSPHEKLQQYAAQRLAPIGFQRLWDAWSRLDERRCLAAGRALLKIDPHFQRSLHEKLETDDRSTKLRALNMIAVLNIGPEFESALHDLAEASDEVIASAAVKALGSVGTKAAIQTVENAMSHEDHRVRANAIEAISQMRSACRIQELARMADNEPNRPRASAIGALMEMKAGEALPALMRMLRDDRPEHRVSALWLVERMGVLEAAQAVAELATSDPNSDVRHRAEQVATDVLEMMQASSQEIARS